MLKTIHLWIAEFMWFLTVKVDICHLVNLDGKLDSFEQATDLAAFMFLMDDIKKSDSEDSDDDNLDDDLFEDSDEDELY